MSMTKSGGTRYDSSWVFFSSWCFYREIVTLYFLITVMMMSQEHSLIFFILKKSEILHLWTVIRFHGILEIDTCSKVISYLPFLDLLRKLSVSSAHLPSAGRASELPPFDRLLDVPFACCSLLLVFRAFNSLPWTERNFYRQCNF